MKAPTWPLSTFPSRPSHCRCTPTEAVPFLGNPEGSKTIHSVNFTFKAPSQPGPFHATVEVQPDLKDEPPAKVTVFATVVP